MLEDESYGSEPESRVSPDNVSPHVGADELKQAIEAEASAMRNSPPSEDLEAFKARLRPLMSTVLNCLRMGHPDVHRHAQALSDVIQN
jgi:hypothetical protein